ncbi:nonribosomal peptide synthase [Pseudohyphozyma bogoriensis]|nr:nonribosomal peptide synthase [Pseudohyphozyma bogoriensis]
MSPISLRDSDAPQPSSAAAHTTPSSADDPYPNCNTLHSIILHSASLHSTETAILSPDADPRTTSYATLSDNSARFAALFYSLLPPPKASGRIITVHLPASAVLPPVLLGLLRAGQGYLNLEVSWPIERKLTVLRELKKSQGGRFWTGVGVVGSKEEKKAWSEWKDEAGETLFDSLVVAGDTVPDVDPLPELSEPPPESPAYLIFTSGSTGTPKGIVISHSNVVAFLKNYHGVLGRDVGDIAGPTAGVGVDVMVVGLWHTLAHGATYHPIRLDQLSLLPSIVQSSKLTVMDLTPTLSTLLFEAASPEEWVQSGFGSLKRVNMGGEKVEEWVRDEWRARGVEVAIDYGPSETTVGIICNRDCATGPITLGKPIGSTIITLLPPDSLTPIPHDSEEEGEICVSGPQVSLEGYMKEELNGVFFELKGKGRSYRTGDWGKWGREGEIVFMGRRDGMVKVNGVRMEVGEIEARLNKSLYEGLRRGVVDKLEQDGLAPGLVAFLLLKPGMAFDVPSTPSSDDHHPPRILPIVDDPEFHRVVETMKKRLAESLPAAMVPRYWLPVDRIPTSGMGKTDRKTLKQLAASHSFRRTGSRSRTREEGDRKSDEASEAVRRAWAGVLRMSEGEIEDDDKFTRLGGDSIGFLKVFARLKQEGWSVSFKSLGTAETADECAEVLRSCGKGQGEVKTETYKPFSLVGEDVLEELHATLGISRGELEDVLPTSPAQDAILVPSVDTTHYYAQAVYPILDDGVEVEILERALKELVRRHAVLRTGFAVGPQGVVQVVWKADSAKVERESAVKVVKGTRADLEKTVDDWMKEDRQGHVFEWGSLAINFTLFVFEGVRKLGWGMHHAMSDGWTLELLTSDLRDLCQGHSLPPRPPFSNVVKWWADRQPSSTTTEFWKSYLAAAHPLDWPNTAPAHGDLLCTSSATSISWTGDLHHLSKSDGITPAIASRLAIAWALAKHAGSQDVCIGVVRSGRDIDVVGADEIIGPCVSVLPSRIRFDSPATLRDLAHAESAMDRQVRAHQQVTLSEIFKIASLGSRDELFNILVTYQSRAERGEEEESRAPWVIRQPPERISMPTNYALSFEVTPDVEGDELELSCFYDSRVIDEKEVKEVLRTIASTLDRLVTTPCSLAGELDTISSSSHTRSEGTKEDLGELNADGERLLERLRPIWSTILRLDAEQASPEDTFSSLGGDSIAFLRLAVALKRAGLAIPQATLASLQTMAAQAAWLARSDRSITRKSVCCRVSDSAAASSRARLILDRIVNMSGTRLRSPVVALSRTALPSSRTFFTLPQLPFGPGSSSSTPPSSAAGSLKKQGSIWVYEEGRKMNYTPQQLYAVIADVDSYHSFLPFATSSSVLKAAKVTAKGKEKEDLASQGWLKGGEEGERWELEADLQVGALGFSEGYVSRVDTVKWKEVAATAKDTSIFKHLVTRWTLSPLPPTPDNPSRPLTQVDLYLAYAFASPFHAAAVSAVWEKVSGLMVDGFEKRARSVYGR